MISPMTANPDLRAGMRVYPGIRFAGGCPGNLEAVARLAEGLPAEAVISRLEGIQCGSKPTSCPDQLARALKRELAARGA